MSYPRVFGCFDLKLHHMWLRDSMDWYCLLPSKQGQLWKIAHSKQECSLQMGLELLGLKPADLPKQSLLAMYHSFIGSLQMNSPRVSFHPNSHHPSHPVPSCPILSHPVRPVVSPKVSGDPQQQSSRPRWMDPSSTETPCCHCARRPCLVRVDEWFLGAVGGLGTGIAES